MMSLDGIAAKNGAVLINEVPGISWRMTVAGATEKAQPSLLQRLFGFCMEEAAEDCANGYLCWTCGASYDAGKAMEFLRHIKVCCRD